jgi:hypothetical protein
MSDQPKPTTGEWTPESVRLLAVVNTKGAEKIANAHNAALAAEREKVQKLQDQVARDAVNLVNLGQQLAAEREKRRIDLEHILDLDRTNQRLREQLADGYRMTQVAIAAAQEGK